MKIERNTPDEPGDEELTRVLRDVYASPAANASYWDTLETRIMARIATAGEAPEWWGVFDGWIRVGLAAALLAGVLAGSALLRARAAQERLATPPLRRLAGSALLRARAAQERLAYEAVMESASVIPIAGPNLARGPGRAARDATLRSLMSR
jgi:hypothetical protein